MILKVSMPGKFQFRILRREGSLLFSKQGDIHYIGGTEVLPPPLMDEQENEMIEIHRQLSSFAQQDTSMNHYMYDDLFHSKLAEYSGSPRICELLGRMRLQMQRARWLNLASPNRLEASVKEHDAILSAILHHEQDECIRLLRLHLKNSETALRSILQDKQIQALAMMVSNFCNQD